MRIDILTFGSRGDVQPYIALGLGLRSAGHNVRLVTLGGFENLVRGYGLENVSVAGTPQEITGSAAGQEWVKDRGTVLGFLRGFVRMTSTLVHDSLARYWRVCQGTEAIIASASGLMVGVHVAEKMRLPLVRAQYGPSVPTLYDWNGRTGPAIAMRGVCEALAGKAWRSLLWQGLSGSTNRSRSELLGLPPLPKVQEPFAALHRKRIPLLDGYSPTVVPRPPDWGEWIHVTGYWFLDTNADWQPPQELLDFLDAGPAPVFVGFGSVPFPNAESTTSLVSKALARAGRRGVVVAGGSEMATGRLSKDVLSVRTVPYDWLFDRVCAAVHQGGAGVTGAVLRAGLPSVVVPVFGDHAFWAQRVFDLGAAPKFIAAKQLSVDTLADAIRFATGDEQIRRRAADIGERIRAEDGVARAVEIFHRHVRNTSSPIRESRGAQ